MVLEPNIDPPVVVFEPNIDPPAVEEGSAAGFAAADPNIELTSAAAGGFPVVEPKIDPLVVVASVAGWVDPKIDPVVSVVGLAVDVPNIEPLIAVDSVAGLVDPKIDPLRAVDSVAGLVDPKIDPLTAVDSVAGLVDPKIDPLVSVDGLADEAPKMDPLVVAGSVAGLEVPKIETTGSVAGGLPAEAVPPNIDPVGAVGGSVVGLLPVLGAPVWPKMLILGPPSDCFPVAPKILLLVGPKILATSFPPPCFFGDASLSLSSAPGANPSSSMKSASDTLDGSPQTNVPAGGAADVAGFFRGEGCRFRGDGSLAGGADNRTRFGDSGTLGSVFKLRLGEGADPNSAPTGSANPCLGDPPTPGIDTGESFWTAGACGEGGTELTAPESMSCKETGREDDILLNLMGRRG